MPLNYACRRVRLILKEINRLKDSDFPYTHSLSALEELEKLFKKKLENLENFTSEHDPDVIKIACLDSLRNIFFYLPFLGFILRSTNVRNSFEIFGPLLRLARQVLGDKVKLIISSEWNFSPHIYSPIDDLPNYVLLGLPASEAGNPLLIPLAGHELGHTTWNTRCLSEVFQNKIRDGLHDYVKANSVDYADVFGTKNSEVLFIDSNMSPAYRWAQSQVEESFCDFLGVRIFTEAYLYSFAYLLSPGLNERHENYPSITKRALNLIRASEKYEVTPPSGFADWFQEEEEITEDAKYLFLLKAAEYSCEHVIDELIIKVNKIASEADIPRRSEEKIGSVLGSFKILTPASSISDLVNILNAGWKAFHDESLWEETVESHNRIDTLNELILKSIEILEFEERTKAVK